MTKTERPRIRVRVENGRLTAVSAADQEQIDKLPLGLIVAEIDTEDATDGARNFYMAGIGLLYANIDDVGPGRTFPTETHLRRHILRATGFAEPIHRVDGIKLEARSMARGYMEYDEIQKVLELSRVYTFERWNIDPWALWEEQHPT